MPAFFLSSQGISIVIFFFGLIFTFIASYIKFMNEFNYIKGQLSLILKLSDDVNVLSKKHDKMEREIFETSLRLAHFEHLNN